MLRPSRPMIRPFISSFGRWTTVTVCSAVWSAATRWIAVTMMSRAFSSASSRALRSIARPSLTASCSASSRTASSRSALGILGGHAAHALERGDLLLVGLRDLLAGTVDLALALEQLAVALLEHVGALIELLVALEEAPLEGGQLVAAGSGLVLGFALHAELLVLRLEDQLLLAGAGLGLDASRLRRARPSSTAMPSSLRASMPSTAPPTAASEGHRDDDR